MEKAKKTCIEMIDARKYVLVAEDDDEIQALNSDSEVVVFKFVKDIKIGIDYVKCLMKDMDEDGVRHMILIHNTSVTFSAKDAFNMAPNMEFEFFLFSELQYNITKHRFVPKHIKLDIEEGRKIKEIYSHKIQAILKTEPISRFYGFKKGDIIEIHRDDGITYRLVK